MAYREGERELREAVARALGEGRSQVDYGRWFVYDGNQAMIGSPELVERFFDGLAYAMHKAFSLGAMVMVSDFGTFHVEKTRSRVGSGVLAGQVLPARKRVVFASSLGRMGVEGLGGEGRGQPII